MPMIMVTTVITMQMVIDMMTVTTTFLVIRTIIGVTRNVATAIFRHSVSHHLPTRRVLRGRYEFMPVGVSVMKE